MTFAQSTLARARPVWAWIRNRAVPRTGFEELSRVRSVTSVSDEYCRVPAGAVGTIVHVYERGQAFEVEFDSPEPAVLFTKRDQIAAEWTPPSQARLTLVVASDK